MLLAVQAAPSLWGDKTLPLSSLFTSEVELTAVIAAGLLRIWGIWLNFVVENECIAEFSQLILTHSLTHTSALFVTTEMDLFNFKLVWTVQSEKIRNFQVKMFQQRLYIVEFSKKRKKFATATLLFCLKPQI